MLRIMVATYDNWSNWRQNKISREIYNNIDWELLKHGFVKTRFDTYFVAVSGDLSKDFATIWKKKTNKMYASKAGARIWKVRCQLICVD